MGPEQVLEINPTHSIVFSGTFKEVLSQKITIKNPLERSVAFKVKTTTPRQYCVRPSLGCVGPGQTKEVSIMLQPLQYTLSEKAKHKFMIQSIIISEDDSANIDLVWKNAPSNSIMCSKLLSVLIQTNETTEVQEKPEDHTDHTLDDMMSFNDSVEQLLEEDVAKVMLQSGDFNNKEMSDSDSKAFSEILEENSKLKDQVSTLKKMVFDNTYKLETMQEEMVSEKEHAIAGVTYDQSVMKESFGLPMVVYLLIAFFLGLVIGRFIL